ncbi:dephospho-CoA kinase [Malassezia sp. CBS 17886]|nr:dephospho-CoA kinase [Malassezia sp. CBS 17886]
MIIVGLSGGIASGKSTVVRLLREQGIPLVDLDELARDVVEKGAPTLRRLEHAFGSCILNEDGTLNRAELGRIAFSDPARTKELNRITHAAIRRRLAWILVRLWLRGTRRVVVDTPLLIEAGLYKWCADVVLVWASSESHQFARMMRRDGASKGLTEADARARLAAQHNLSAKLAYADIIVDNSVDADVVPSPHLRAQVGALVKRWRREDSQPLHVVLWLLCWICPPFGLLWGFIMARLRNARREQRLQVDRALHSKRE